MTIQVVRTRDGFRAWPAAVLSVAALFAVRPLPASAADIVWVGNDSFSSSDFSNSGNWQNNTNPSWGFGNTLKFNQNQNSNVTGLIYNLSGGWRDVNDIFWDNTFPVARTLSSSNGDGINFKIRLENRSSFTQTVTMPLSGGKDGAVEIQLNPVDGSLILSGTIYNDNSKDYVVFGSLSGTTTNLTLNTALGPNATQANVDFAVASGRNTAVQVNASQVWAGTTTVDSGAFTTANGVTLASTAIVVAGGTVATTSANTLADSATLTVNSGRLSIGGSDTVASLAGSGGTVNLAAGATLTFGGSASSSYAGAITGSGNLSKLGSGTFTLSAASSMTGTTTVSAGQFSLGGSNLLADTSAVAVAGGVLALGGNSDTVGAFTISDGSLTGSGTVTAANYGLGGGTVAANLGSGTVTVTGNAALNGTSQGATLNLTSGTLTLGSAGRLAATTALAVTGSAGGALTLGGNETIGSLAGAANVALGSSTLTVGGDNTSTTYSGGLSGAGAVTKVGSGVVTLSGSNSYGGGTVVSAGGLAIGSGGSTGSVAGDIVNNAAVTFNRSNAVLYSGVISGTGTVTKQGAGNLVLGGTSTYTGATTVSAGRLSVNGALGSSPISVLASAELGGSGSIGGPVSVANGATLAPGNSIESLATGSATFAGGATFAYEVDSTNPLSLGSAADLLVVNGDLNLDTGNGTILTVTDVAGSPNPFVNNTTIFALINYAGAWNGGLFTYGGTPLADGGEFTVGSQRWVIDYDRTSPTGLDNFTGDYLPSSKFVAFTAVPEPSTCIMALAGLACGGFSMWRLRKRA